MNDFAQAEGGVVAYAASTGREFSFERDEWGHGAFTKALIEGLGGKADLLHKGTVTTATLDAFLEDRVKELTGGQQHPVMTRPKTVPDFPIADRAVGVAARTAKACTPSCRGQPPRRTPSASLWRASQSPGASQMAARPHVAGCREVHGIPSYACAWPGMTAR